MSLRRLCMRHLVHALIDIIHRQRMRRIVRQILQVVPLAIADDGAVVRLDLLRDAGRPIRAARHVT